MRFISMHKSDAACEADTPPEPELVAGMGELIGEMTRAGAFLGAEGLRSSTHGVRLRFAGGRRTVIAGPFVGENELLSGFAIVRVRSIDEAVDWATRYGVLAGDVEIDIRPVNEPWDIGICPKPEGLETTRYMIAHKATLESEAGAPPPPDRVQGIAALRAEMAEAGVFAGAVRIQPSAKGVRLHFVQGKHTITDGPFTESKELIAGYCLLEVPSLQEAIRWAFPFARVIGDAEIDIRPVYEPADRAWGWHEGGVHA